MLIKKNVRILNSSKSEMLKLACVLQEVNLNDEIFYKITGSNIATLYSFNTWQGYVNE